jgi:hypothetical protein
VKTNKKKYQAILMIGAACLLPPVVGAEVSSATSQVVALRAQLETLSREVEALSKERQAEVDLWTQKRMELEGSLQKERLRGMQLDEKILRNSARIRNENRGKTVIQGPLLKWIEVAEKRVKSSLPVRRVERLAALEQLRERALAGVESHEVLAGELWQTLETELKMASSHEYRIESLFLDGSGGEATKAELARIGINAAFAATPDGRVFSARMNRGNWAWLPIEKAEELGEAKRLIGNFKKKKDSGLYQLNLIEVSEAKL